VGGSAAAPIAIVLAAGKGTRAGVEKLLQVVDGKPIVEWAISSFARSQRVHDVVLVIPKGGTATFGWLKGLRTHLVEVPVADAPMIASIRAGLQSTWALEKDFLVHPADVPFVKPEIVDRITREFATRSAEILLPAYKGLGGHPGMYGAHLRQEFFLRGDANGAREILLRHRDRTVRINLPDPDVCFDVDTPEDLKAAADPGARWARVEQEVESRRAGRGR
jgi:CTP:molybdopterin cytidylyltransferase MocA